jgi:Zn-dependent protease
MHVGTLWGIPLKVHWTLGLLMLFFGYVAFSNNLKLWQAIGLMSLVVVLFLCVVLHEYGHALAAKRFGIKTKDIILSPIGGVARLETMSEHPFTEFVIALAGPMVNLMIMLVLGVGMYFYDGNVFPKVYDFKFSEPLELVKYVIGMNGLLFAFNLIPAFPMDGGRILRSLLATRMSHHKATRIATFAGRMFAVGFMLYGVIGQQLVWSLIGLIIFMMAGQESDQSRFNFILKNTLVSKAMRTSFTKFHVNDPYQTLINHYNASNEKNFLVYDSNGNIAGGIPELFIKDVIKNQQPDKLLGELMTQKLGKIAVDTTIRDVFELMKSNGYAICIIEDKGQFIGIIDRNDVESFVNKIG